MLTVGGMEIAPVEADEPHRGAAFDGDGLLIGQREACPPGVDRVIVVIVGCPYLIGIGRGGIGETELVVED